MEFIIAIPFVLIVGALLYFAYKEIRSSVELKKANDEYLRKLQKTISENQLKADREKARQIVERRTEMSKVHAMSYGSTSDLRGSKAMATPVTRVFPPQTRSVSSTERKYETTEVVDNTTSNLVMMALVADALSTNNTHAEVCSPAPVPEYRPDSYSPAPSPASQCHSSSDSYSSSSSYDSSSSDSYSSSSSSWD